uniref:WD40 repeat domain-containing protein n=1 Tax=Salmonella sp. s51228 TaxID=3159652 RepID=UPI00398002DF
WDFDEIDQADVIDDNDVVEMEPLIEIKIKGYNGASLRHIEKLNDNDNPTFWVAQNNQGSIMKVDLQVSHTHKPPERLFSYHSGAITGVSVCPFALYAVTSGQDGRIRLYDIDTKLF